MGTCGVEVQKVIVEDMAGMTLFLIELNTTQLSRTLKSKQIRASELFKMVFSERDGITDTTRTIAAGDMPSSLSTAVMLLRHLINTCITGTKTTLKSHGVLKRISSSGLQLPQVVETHIDGKVVVAGLMHTIASRCSTWATSLKPQSVQLTRVYVNFF